MEVTAAASALERVYREHGERLWRGEGGLWPLYARGPAPEYHHIDADGALDLVVDASGDEGLRGGQHVAYDPVTRTSWFVQYRDMVIRVHIV